MHLVNVSGGADGARSLGQHTSTSTPSTHTTTGGRPSSRNENEKPHAGAQWRIAPGLSSHATSGHAAMRQNTSLCYLKCGCLVSFHIKRFFKLTCWSTSRLHLNHAFFLSTCTCCCRPIQLRDHLCTMSHSRFVNILLFFILM